MSDPVTVEPFDESPAPRTVRVRRRRRSREAPPASPEKSSGVLVAILVVVTLILLALVLPALGLISFEVFSEAPPGATGPP